MPASFGVRGPGEMTKPEGLNLITSSAEQKLFLITLTLKNLEMLHLKEQ